MDLYNKIASRTLHWQRNPWKEKKNSFIVESMKVLPKPRIAAWVFKIQMSSRWNTTKHPEKKSLKKNQNQKGMKDFERNKRLQNQTLNKYFPRIFRYVSSDSNIKFSYFSSLSLNTLLFHLLYTVQYTLFLFFFIILSNLCIFIFLYYFVCFIKKRE